MSIRELLGSSESIIIAYDVLLEVLLLRIRGMCHSFRINSFLERFYPPTLLLASTLLY